MFDNSSLEYHDDVDDDDEDGDDELSSILQINSVLKETEIPNVDFLEDLDSYLDDINDRLTISRVVNDSIMRGMVNAIESDASEKLAQKDLELSRVKETLSLYRVGSEEEACLDLPDNGFSQGSLNSLKSVARKQLLMLVGELTSLRKYVHIHGSDGVVDDDGRLGLDGLKNVDKMLDSFKNVLETVLKRKNETDIPSSWQEEHDFRKEIEVSVVASFVRSLKDEYQQRLLGKEADLDSRTMVLGNVKEITCLRLELEAIRKSLLDNDYGEIEAGETGDRKRVERLQRKMSGSRNSAASLYDTNGKQEESSEALKHLTCDEVISHFKTQMNKMKIDHDYEIQGVTEQCFEFKRKYLNLKEGGSFSPVGKDKELEVMRKKIPSVISKLDKILSEDVKVVSEGKDNAGFKSLLDSLIQENRQLKDSLSDSSEKMLQLSQAEADHQIFIRKLESDVEDSRVEASIYEDVYGCFVTEFLSQIKCAKQETDLEHSTMREAYELVLEDLASKKSRESKDEFEDSCVESSMMEECCAVIYKESLKEADKKIVELNMHVTETGKALRSAMVDKETLKEQIHRLKCVVKEKEGLVQISEDNLDTLRKKLEGVSQQINELQSRIDQQQTEIQDKNIALGLVSAREIHNIEAYEAKVSDLTQELELARENLKKTKDEKRKTKDNLSATEAELEKLMSQLLSLDLVPPKLMQGYNILEGLVAEKTQKTNSRLKSMHSQLCDLSWQMNELKGKASMYKQRFEKKCCDLQKAEDEVDVLGDEVESLLDILEKIYIALDHYSPILKHYPGIIEILKLVRRELNNEESKKPSD
ncbi:unnamed protein product [Cochlearia groenlandica]